MALELLSEFPYLKVGNYIFDNYYSSGSVLSDWLGVTQRYKEAWPNNKITQLWYYYEQGLENGNIKAVDIRKSMKNADYLARVTPYSKADIIWWLTAVQDLAKNGTIDAGFYTGNRVASNPIAKITQKIGDEIAGAGKAAKLGVGLAAGALVLYLSWPVIMGTAKKRMRRKIARA